ncbi:helix-turn-helix transcriptional regulator [Knoellia subterranea]|uniref:Transcriptional regulator n=1 Tax=Knoellia subterranea KCTC 19937 TaxID=1385521 RepID=A0A0A0JJC7_9MICO|nr:YafY family protein [Knoellia subterranea]KGN37198.1 transcriptional regulator [Knoellia subterranea KCTC 19937]
MANTSSRTLRLLSLLQTHRFWPGGELASRLEVSERTLRRDVERLRELGYPVSSSRGVDGGYQLGAGGSMPPLVVDEDEAIAMVVALGQTASAQSGALADSTLSALSKVVQVLPTRLRRRAESLRAVTVDSPFATAPEVEASVLGAIAQAIRDSERIRFSYTARGGSGAGAEVRRHVEPHQLVTVGRRWYLLAFDLERADWRSFRLDRLTEPLGTKSLFRRRAIPGGDAAAYVKAGLQGRNDAHRLVTVVHAPVADVEKRIGRWTTVEDLGDGRCRVSAESRDVGFLLLGMGLVEAPFTIEDASPGVRETMASWAERFDAAATGAAGGAGSDTGGAVG